MATPFRNIGSIESSDALASMNGTGAFMDYDSTNGYARFGSKGGVGVSLGTRIATVLNGVLQNAITIAANALTITLLAGSMLAAQAVTATAATIASGTITASAPAVAATQTWNAGGVAFTAMKVNVTNTASAAGSLLLDLQVGGTSKFSVDKTGAVTATTVSSPSLTCASVGADSGPGLFYRNATYGMTIWGVAGSFANVGIFNSAGTPCLYVPNGSSAVTIAAGLTVSAGGIVSSAGTNTFSGVIQPVGGIDCQLAAFKLVNVVTTASATAGTNGAVPAQVLGYLELALGATTVKVPYFSV